MTNDILLKRLSIIKHLYRLGEQQAALPESIAYSSILLFHDAIDMFNQLASEYLGKTDRDKKAITNGRSHLFMMEYFDLIPSLTLQPSVKKINERRNSLKHNGQIPAKLEIEESRLITKLFFEQNTPILFDIEFNDVSLINLIENNLVRNFLKNAENELQNKAYQNCFEEVAKAFFELTNIEDDDYYDRRFGYYFKNRLKTLRWGYKPIANAFSQLKPSQWNASNKASEFDSQLKEALKNYDENFNIISNSLTIISLGIDYRKYVKFDILVPKVHKGFNHKENKEVYHVYKTHYSSYLTEENCQFIFDFTLECALRIQDFNY